MPGPGHTGRADHSRTTSAAIRVRDNTHRSQGQPLVEVILRVGRGQWLELVDEFKAPLRFAVNQIRHQQQGMRSDMLRQQRDRLLEVYDCFRELPPVERQLAAAHVEPPVRCTHEFGFADSSLGPVEVAAEQQIDGVLFLLGNAVLREEMSAIAEQGRDEDRHTGTRQCR